MGNNNLFKLMTLDANMNTSGIEECFFCPSAILGYLGGKMGDKTGENLQISKLKIKNLQKWAQFLMLEINRIMS